MANSTNENTGKIGWIDLTVADADRLRDFYRVVTGWSSSEISMGDYSDYVMLAPAANVPVSGICHARGGNAGIPPQWMIYITVEDIDASAESCVQLGGELIAPIKDYGDQGRYCMIKDPAGAVCALYQELKPRE
jgi:predicted enzyme related to lactoylglutathione lyase